MIKPTSDGGVASHSISPIRGNCKHQMTPLKTRGKTSRKDQSADVHTCSTPNRLQLGSNQCSSTLNSPDSFLYSQENCPDVVWDYTSPKLPKGSKKREIKITVDEFLKNLPHDQASECNTQKSNHIKLLEKWMAKQNTPPMCVKKPVRTMKRDCKMRSRRVFEEIKQFMESMQQKNEKVAAEENNSKETRDENALKRIENGNESGISLNKKSFLEGDDDNEKDSIDELWDEADNSFIVKATQHLDFSCPTHIVQNKNLDIQSTIPETIINTSNECKSTSTEEEKSTGNILNKAILDSDHQAQILLTQIMSCDWDSDSDNENLENCFIMGDEDLSLIPDEVLCGTENKVKFERTEQRITEQRFNNEAVNTKLLGSSGTSQQYNVKRSPEITFGGSEPNRVTSELDDISEVELFNNFEDDSFGDESILCQPEVLSWIDEVENKLSQSQKCTPEEIEKKKDEAIQRRKKNLSKTENS